MPSLARVIYDPLLVRLDLQRSLAALACAIACVACDGAPGCTDTDLDDYGPGCELGEDCDPDNASRNVDCAAVLPPDCAALPTATGCPCLPGAITDCLEEHGGAGPCRAGRTSCVNGHWGMCRGGIGPQSETCDGVDQDCDGVIDDGVVSPCGGCTPGCYGGVWGEGPEPFEAGEDLATTRFGELTLATLERTFPTLWVANSADATLSRIDAESAVETARYFTGGSEPSRVAVDFAGDAWVVNREFDGTSSVIKVAGDRSRCVDADGDGLETSSGPADVRGLADECVLLQVPVGEPGDVGRALAIDGDRGLDGVSGGDAWVGLHDGEAVVELDGLSGEVLTRIETPGFQPYSASFDRWGTLWMISRDGLVARVDPESTIAEILEVPLPCYLLYGLAIDGAGRLLMTGFSCDRIVSYDPALDRWATRSSPPSPRAAVYDGATDRFWIAHTAAMVSEVAIDPLRIVRTRALGDDAASPVETIGVAVDALGQVWAVSSRGGPSGAGIASRLDPVRDEVSAQLVVGGSPHVQEDLAGARVRYGLAQRASATHVFRGCGPDVPTSWARLHVDATPGARGRVAIELRRADDERGLAAAEYAHVGTIPAEPAPYTLALPEGGLVEVRLTLEVDGDVGAPRVRRVGIEWRCPGPD